MKKTAKKKQPQLDFFDLKEICYKIRFPDSCKYRVRFLLKEEEKYGSVVFAKLSEAKQFADILNKNGYASDEYEVVKEENPETPTDWRIDTTYTPPYKMQVRGYSPPHEVDSNTIFCSTLTYPFKDEVKRTKNGKIIRKKKHVPSVEEELVNSNCLRVISTGY